VRTGSSPSLGVRATGYKAYDAYDRYDVIHVGDAVKGYTILVIVIGATREAWTHVILLSTDGAKR
jgi:hypothetical protein